MLPAALQSSFSSWQQQSQWEQHRQDQQQPQRQRQQQQQKEEEGEDEEELLLLLLRLVLAVGARMVCARAGVLSRGACMGGAAQRSPRASWARTGVARARVRAEVRVLARVIAGRCVLGARTGGVGTVGGVRAHTGRSTLWAHKAGTFKRKAVR